MTTLDFMTKRYARLVEARKSLEEGKIIVDMREKDGENVAINRQELEDAIQVNETAQKNTLEAIEQLKELENSLKSE